MNIDLKQEARARKNMRDHRREIFIVLAFGLVLGRTESLMKILRSWFSQRPRILADPLRLSILPGVSASRARSKKYLARVGKGFSGCWVAFGLLSKKSTNKAVHGHTPRCRWLDHLKAGRNKVSPQILKFVDSGPRPLKQVHTSTSGGFFDVSYFQMVRCRHATSQSSFSARPPTCLHIESRESNILAESPRWTLVHRGSH